MESDEGIKLRKKALKPIQTQIPNSLSSENYDEKESEEEEEERPLTPTSRLFQEPKLNLHIVSIVGCKSKIDPDVIKANFPHLLRNNYRFSSVLVADKDYGGKMKWVRTKVNLDKHIIVPEVDPSALSKYTSPEQFIEEYVRNLTKTDLNDDMSRPLWELHIINVKTSEAEATGIFRIHHSLGDGITLMSLLLSYTRQSSDPKAFANLQTNKSKFHESSYRGIEKNSFRTKLLQFLFGIWWFLRLFLNTIIDLLFTVSLFIDRDKGLPTKGPPSSTQRSSWRIVFKNVSLDDLKLVKDALDATLNVVVVGATQAGLSMYYNRLYGLENKNDDEEPTGHDQGIKDNLPKRRIRLRSLVIVNVRQLIGFRVSKKLGNWFGYALLPLNIELKDDPVDYVREAKAHLDRKRHSLEALWSFAFMGLVYKIFGIKLASTLFRRFTTSCSIAFSNVVGPLEEVGFHGHSISYMASTTYGQPIELMVCFQSYMNKMSLVLSGDEDFFPDLHLLRDDIAESIKRIANSVREKELVKEKDNQL